MMRRAISPRLWPAEDHKAAACAVKFGAPSAIRKCAGVNTRAYLREFKFHAARSLTIRNGYVGEKRRVADDRR